MKALHKCQEECELRPTMPVKLVVTRWLATFLSIFWIYENLNALKRYTQHKLSAGASMSVDNEDGSTYNDHQLDSSDHVIVFQMVSGEHTPPLPPMKKVLSPIILANLKRIRYKTTF